MQYPDPATTRSMNDAEERPPAGGFGAQVSELGPMIHANAWLPFEFRESVGFWPRAGARAIDLIATLLISTTGAFLGALILGLLEVAGVISPGSAERIDHPAPLWSIVGFIVPVFYDSIAEATGGTTVGKLLLGYRVCRLDGRRPSILQALGRNFAYFIDSLFFALPAYNAMKSSPLNQRLGDKWAGTVVVRRSAIVARGDNVPYGFSVGAGLFGIGIAAAVFGALSVAETILTGIF